MKILILGASGFIGGALRKRLADKYEVYGTCCTQSKDYAEDSRMLHLDVQSVQNLNKMLEIIKPDCIISCLRGDFDRQLALHRQAAQYLKMIPDGRMIFFSSANVFDNASDAPHYEEDMTDAKSEYGRYKAACEEMLSTILKEACTIVRIPAVWGKGCPRIKALCTAKTVSACTNIKINLASDIQIADYVQWMLENKRTGIFHIGTTDSMDYLSIQKLACKKLGIPEPQFQVESCKTQEYQAVFSKRPDMAALRQWTIEDVMNTLSL